MRVGREEPQSHKDPLFSNSYPSFFPSLQLTLPPVVSCTPGLDPPPRVHGKGRPLSLRRPLVTPVSTLAPHGRKGRETPQEVDVTRPLLSLSGDPPPGSSSPPDFRPTGPGVPFGPVLKGGVEGWGTDRAPLEEVSGTRTLSSPLPHYTELVNHLLSSRPPISSFTSLCDWPSYTSSTNTYPLPRPLSLAPFLRLQGSPGDG